MHKRFQGLELALYMRDVARGVRPGGGVHGFNFFDPGRHTGEILPNDVQPSFQHEQRRIPLDLVPGQLIQAAFQARPLLFIHQLVAEFCDQSAGRPCVTGSQGMLKSLLQQAVFGKPGTGIGVEGVDIFEAGIPFGIERLSMKIQEIMSAT